MKASERPITIISVTVGVVVALVIAKITWGFVGHPFYIPILGVIGGAIGATIWSDGTT